MPARWARERTRCHCVCTRVGLRQPSCTGRRMSCDACAISPRMVPCYVVQSSRPDRVPLDRNEMDVFAVLRTQNFSGSRALRARDAYGRAAPTAIGALSVFMGGGRRHQLMVCQVLPDGRIRRLERLSMDYFDRGAACGSASKASPEE